MQNFYLDTNVIVSYLYRRNEKQYVYAKSYFYKAKKRISQAQVNKIQVQVEDGMSYIHIQDMKMQ